MPFETHFRATSTLCPPKPLGGFSLFCLVVTVLLGSLCYGQATKVTAVAGTPTSGPINTELAGHWFEQRGDGTANVATNFNFVGNTFQDSPALRVNGKPFSVAFWYRSTQTGPFRLIWENGEVGAATGYVVGLHNGYMAIEEMNGGTGCSFIDWLHGSTTTNDGLWHHAAIVADRNNAAGADTAHTYIYKDGVLDGTLPYCDPADNTTDGGNQWYGIGRNFPTIDYAGDIDHFTAWAGSALTSAEVNYHMQGGMPQLGNIGVWYEFENAVGQLVPDLGSNHYDGHVSPDATPLLGPAPAFQALVQDVNGNPVPGVEVVFTAPASGPSGTFINGLRVAKATTNGTGKAIAPVFTANGIPGSYSVTAKVAVVATAARFAVTNQVSVGASAGTPQSTPVLTAFPYQLQAVVLDSKGSPVPNVTVTFKAPTSGARATFPDGTAAATAVTNASGLATSPVLTANNVAGAFVVKATAPGGSTTANFALSNTVGTTTTLTSSLNPSAYNQSVTLTVTVTATSDNTPTGTVTITDTTLGTTLATLTLVNGCALNTRILAVGSHALQASFSDGTGFLPSLGTLTQNVSPSNSTVWMSSNLSPSLFQQSVTFTAKVTPQFGGAATGSITFMDGATAISLPIAVNSSKTATFSTSKLPVGSRSITAVYGADPNIAGSTSPVYTQYVNQANVKITIQSSSPSGSKVGQLVTFKVTVSPNPAGPVLPTGTVTFSLAETVYGTVPLDATGKASLAISTLPSGDDFVVVTYNGDTNFVVNAAGIVQAVR